MTTRLEAYVFFFDLLGFTEQYCSNGQFTLARLRQFQRDSRRAFCFSSPHTYVVTLYDNVWCRVNATETGALSLVLDYAGDVMSAAIVNGFPLFFGAITKGLHEFDEDDRILVGKESFEDLTEQHIDITSEPHIRAAMAEKWAKSSDDRAGCVLVSNEVASSDEIKAYSVLPDSKFTLLSRTVDFLDVSNCHRKWPFEQSRFQAIGPRGRRNGA